MKEFDIRLIKPEVQLSAKDDDPDLGDVHDSVRIGDGTDELAINSDGSINVNIVVHLAFGIMGCLIGVLDFYGENYGWCALNLIFSLINLHVYFK